MKNLNENIGFKKSEDVNIAIFLKNFKIRRIEMKTGILFSSILIVLFLVCFCGCNNAKKTETQTGFAGRIIYTDSNLTESTNEIELNNDANYNAQGKTVSYIEETTGNISNSTYDEEEILVDNPNTEDVNLETFENELSSDGNFVKVTEEQIDPDNNVSSETASCDEDIYVNVIWIPNSNYVYEGWNPYTNGRWVRTHYGWTWKSYYKWGSTYHYGRWWYSSRYGWVWSPGRKWAPGWVVWGHHRNYEGWHPISPRIHIRNKGVISPVMPRNKQKEWVIVKNTDFTKKVDNTTLISELKKKDILKNSTVSINLKNDNNKFYNENPNVKIKKDAQVKTVENKSVNKIITKQKSNDNNTTLPVSKTKPTNTVPISKTTGMELQKKSNELNNKTPVTSTSGNKQVNNSTVSTKNTNVENKKTETLTQKKVTENKNVVTTPSTQISKQNNTVNVNKSNTNENKITVKENQKKTTETKPVSVEKSKNNNNNTTSTNNNTKTYNSFNNTKTESPVRTSERTVTKTENTNKTVNTAPKVEQTPKVNKELVKTSQPKNTNKNGNK